MCTVFLEHPSIGEAFTCAFLEAFVAGRTHQA